VSEDPVLYEFDEPAALVTLNRPRRLNALDVATLEGLAGGLESAEATSACRALILTGSGSVFCVGADLAALGWDDDGSGPRGALGRLAARFQDVIRRIAASPLPIIAAINGYASGAGLDLALACDLRIAARRSRLGEAFVLSGLVPDGGGTWFLPRLVGPAVASEMAFTGEPIEAERALALGLVNRVVAAADLLPAARALAQSIALRDRDAVAETKRLIRENLFRNLEGALAAEAEAQLNRVGSAAFREVVDEARKRRTDLPETHPARRAFGPGDQRRRPRTIRTEPADAESSTAGERVPFPVEAPECPLELPPLLADHRRADPPPPRPVPPEALRAVHVERHEDDRPAARPRDPAEPSPGRGEEGGRVDDGDESPGQPTVEDHSSSRKASAEAVWSASSPETSSRNRSDESTSVARKAGAGPGGLPRAGEAAKNHQRPGGSRRTVGFRSGAAIAAGL